MKLKFNFFKDMGMLGMAHEEEQWAKFCSMFASANEMNGILSAELDSYRFKVDENRPFVEIRDVSIDIIVISGQMTIKVDGKDWICTPNEKNFVTIKPMNRLQNISISNNFKGHIIGLSRKFIIKNSFRPRILPIDQVMLLKFYPAITFDESIINNLRAIVSKIERNFSREVFCRDDLVLVSVAEFQLEKIVVIFANFNIEKTAGNKKTTRMKIVMEFNELLFKYCKKEHEVGFYAEKLCITTQYLTRILQDVYSRSAKEIIDYAIISEAIILLGSDMTIQQISDILYFSDQSSFGKFFKKIMSCSPTDYRRDELGD
ncbi:MAG: helix-turn-helix domain-containing protein [Rikenellaceae bacterium]